MNSLMELTLTELAGIIFVWLAVWALSVVTLCL
jgi:hypothetical protein